MEVDLGTWWQRISCLCSSLPQPLCLCHLDPQDLCAALTLLPTLPFACQSQAPQIRDDPGRGCYPPSATSLYTLSSCTPARKCYLEPAFLLHSSSILLSQFLDAESLSLPSPLHEPPGSDIQNSKLPCVEYLLCRHSTTCFTNIRLFSPYDSTKYVLSSSHLQIRIRLRKDKCLIQGFIVTATGKICPSL